ncbi:MarR family winged helix-turn-helix transcriptional regulator [Paenibacillus methanolicus]|uniref:DNA-binding MarR family transcriptional regulator n=1 Tax=Paenibacillus methanolicus TaxID=582686 RepID=A0A5S5CI66_9BACL|nr:MarR family transcriptional regulator [Paenibacillus methanolicus]TYP79486.1 DNA-binding MarR family transcriptional regulator [Paenibacillus methanolicus]
MLEPRMSDRRHPAYAVAIGTLSLIKEFQKAQDMRTDMDRMTFEILLFVKSQQAARPMALARELGVNPSSITRRIQTLIKDGLLDAASDQSDGRSSLLRITERGDSALQSFLDRSVTVIRELLEDWADDDQARFAELLSRYANSMAARRLSRESMTANTTKEDLDV